MLLIFAIFVVFFGAGCVSNVIVPHVAETLTNTTAGVTPRVGGFGTLPKIPVPPSRAAITLARALPLLPDHVTVLRPRRGTPNDTVFRNLANTLEISDGFLGTRADVTTLDLAWSDHAGYKWSYRSAERILEFENDRAPSEPVTVSKIPPNDAIIHIANTFLLERGINPAQFRNPVVEP
ncbi:MAG: hypothetical protein AAB879_01800, partial [Patescibacteria group bacterium]